MNALITILVLSVFLLAVYPLCNHIAKKIEHSTFFGHTKYYQDEDFTRHIKEAYSLIR